MQGHLVEFHKTRYYQIINLYYKYALYVSSGLTKFANQKPYVVQPNQQSLGQLWQIIQITDNLLYKNCYQIVHSRSTLVLTKHDHQVKLKYGDQKLSQLFQIQRIFLKQEGIYAYKFISLENRANCLYQEKHLKIGKLIQRDKRFLWVVVGCINNPIINRSCYFQNIFSNMIIDVPKASMDRGCKLIQYPINNRFNQRFNIFFQNNSYRIANLNSKLFLTAHKNCRQGDPVTQDQKIQNTKQQEWIFEYQGINLFVIRSCLNQKMMIGVKEDCKKPLGAIITTENQEYCLWRIVGYLPNRNALMKC